MRRLLLLALMYVVMASGAASGFVIPSPSPEQEDLHAPRVIPSDPKLPKYDNPFEIDLDGGLHISFKGVFRGLDKNKDLVAFMFVALPQNDMQLWLNKRDVFDGKGTRFNNWGNAWIGRENTAEREIIGAIPIAITRWLKMPAAEAGDFPTISRAEFCFNNKWFQYRNIKVEPWTVWQDIAQELGL